MDHSFYTNNRLRLAQEYATSPIILAGNDEVQRKADAAYEFTQESNFYYLTGIKEAGWTLVLLKDTPILIAPKRSESQVLFDGAVTLGDAATTSGIKDVRTHDALSELLTQLSLETDTASTLGKDPYWKHYGFALNPAQEKLRRVLKRRFKTVEDIRSTLSKLRSIKQPVEIECIRRAVTASAASFESVKTLLPGMKRENEITAQLSYDFLRASADSHAYTPIVAGGAHACTLHYIQNDQPLPENGLVLIDAGVQIQGYASDITRTYATGTPTPRQTQVHAAVQKAHYEIISLITPGLELKGYSEKVDEIMKAAIDSLGLLKSKADYRKYFPHAISHGLGLDVHDSLGGHKAFMPGMILTVEPGIYIPEEGIGVRIEDDILVTETGNENLSARLSTDL